MKHVLVTSIHATYRRTVDASCRVAGSETVGVGLVGLDGVVVSVLPADGVPVYLYTIPHQHVLNYLTCREGLIVVLYTIFVNRHGLYMISGMLCYSVI